MAHQLPGLRHRALDGEGGVSRLLFPGTFLDSGRNWRCIGGESWTSRLRDGAGWPHSPIPPITWNLHKRETRKCTKFAKGKAVRDPAPTPERVAAQAAAARGRQERSPASQSSQAGVGREGELGAPQHPELSPFQPRTLRKEKGGDFLAGH